MEWTEAQTRSFDEGERMLWRDQGERRCLLVFLARGRSWEIALDRRLEIEWVRDLPEHMRSKVLPTQLDSHDHILPFCDVPENLGERARRLVEELEILEPKYEAGESWVPSGSYFLVKHPVLGGLFVDPSAKRISARVHARTDIMKWLWNHPGEMPGVPVEQLAMIGPALDAYTALVKRLETGEITVKLGYRGIVMCSHGRFLSLSGLKLENFERLLFNPYRFTLSIDRLVEWMVESASHEVSGLPDTLRALKSRLDEEFGRPKSDIVDRYIAHIKAGGTISGGPTTDQSWTVRYDGSRFAISGYRPTPDGGHEQTLDPISEEEVRTMISTYRMFGLDE